MITKDHERLNLSSKCDKKLINKKVVDDMTKEPWHYPNIHQMNAAAVVAYGEGDVEHLHGSSWNVDVEHCM